MAQITPIVVHALITAFGLGVTTMALVVAWSIRDRRAIVVISILTIIAAATLGSILMRIA